MLHLLYVLAFTILAFLAIANLIRSMLTLGMESQRGYAPAGWSGGNGGVTARPRPVPHPEFLDDAGNVINEPLLVMRSMSVEDAREHLDALYDSSPGNSNSSDSREES